VSLLWPVLVGLALAVALGGKLQRLARLRLRGLWLFYLGLGVRIVAFPFGFLPWHTPGSIGKPLWLASYAILVLGVAVNARIPGVAIVFVGMASNVAAVLANGGRMPALPSALHAAGKHFIVSRNSELAVHPHLAWLIDRWAAPRWVPLANVFSVGDVIISLGAIVFALVATGAIDRFVPPRLRRTAVAPAG